MNLQRIYETLKREYESKGIQIDEGKLRQMAWMKRDRMLFENTSAVSSSAAAGAAGAGGGGGSGNRRSVTPPTLPGFIFRVDTSLGNGNPSFQIPTGFYTYNYTATWTLVSDPSITGTESGLTGTSTITFPAGGIYDIRITGLFPAMEFGKFSIDPSKVTGIIQWGSNQWQSMRRMFLSCSNLSLYLATDQPDLSAVTNMNSMFSDQSGIGSTNPFNGDISGWDVSGVTDMGLMFSGASLFNADISGWDVSAVTDMSGMFRNATSFNQDISGWNVSSVTDMGFMFVGASSFNQNLSGWCVSLIPSAPQAFDFGATAWRLPRPNWGSPCPG